MYFFQANLLHRMCAGLVLASLCAAHSVSAQTVTLPQDITDLQAAVFKPPSVMKHLATPSLAANNSVADVQEITSAAVGVGGYTVPADKVLVINEVIVFPQSPASGSISMQLIQNNLVRSFWVVPADRPTQLSFSPGLVIAAGYALKAKNFTTSASAIRVSFIGYEAPDT